MSQLLDLLRVVFWYFARSRMCVGGDITSLVLNGRSPTDFLLWRIGRSAIDELLIRLTATWITALKWIVYGTHCSPTQTKNSKLLYCGILAHQASG